MGMEEAIVLDTPEKIEAARLIVLKGALKLETLGMHHSRGIRASVLVRDVLSNHGIKGKRDKKALLAQYIEFLTERRILR